VVEKARAPFDACYAKARAADPNLRHTHVKIAFAINPDGKPMTVDMHYRNKLDDAAKDCMRDAAMSVQFPPSMQGRHTVTLMFVPR
jgi:hypothetical protein